MGVVRGHEDHDRPNGLGQLVQCSDPGLSREVHVEEQEIGVVIADRAHRIGTGGTFADDLHACIVREQRPDAGATGRLVIGDQNANGRHVIGEIDVRAPVSIAEAGLRSILSRGQTNARVGTTNPPISATNAPSRATNTVLGHPRSDHDDRTQDPVVSLGMTWCCRLSAVG